MKENDNRELKEEYVLKESYRIIKKLGKGGMGTVYQAEHIVLKSTVAIKVLKSGVCANRVEQERFVREAIIGANIKHKNLCLVTNAGFDHGMPFLVMEYLDGRSLHSEIAENGALDISKALDIVKDVLTGLQMLHGENIVHRDIKPTNIYIVGEKDNEVATLIDFGIAKVIRESMIPQEKGSNGEIFAEIDTEEGLIIGTREYMSPEQATACSDLDHRADIYSVGVVLYEALTGVCPFRKADGETESKLMNRIVNGLFKSPRELSPDLPLALEKIIRKSMATEPSARFSTANEMKTALENADLTPGASDTRPTSVSVAYAGSAIHRDHLEEDATAISKDVDTTGEMGLDTKSSVKNVPQRITRERSRLNGRRRLVTFFLLLALMVSGLVSVALSLLRASDDTDAAVPDSRSGQVNHTGKTVNRGAKRDESGTPDPLPAVGENRQAPSRELSAQGMSVDRAAHGTPVRQRGANSAKKRSASASDEESDRRPEEKATGEAVSGDTESLNDRRLGEAASRLLHQESEADRRLGGGALEEASYHGARNDKGRRLGEASSRDEARRDQGREADRRLGEASAKEASHDDARILNNQRLGEP